MTDFHEFIRQYKAGNLNAALGEKMKELVNSVIHHGKPGKMMLEITLEPKMEGEILTAVKFKVKAPERDTMESIMFATPDGHLATNDPAQQELFKGPVQVISDEERAVRTM